MDEAVVRIVLQEEANSTTGGAASTGPTSASNTSGSSGTPAQAQGTPRQNPGTQTAPPKPVAATVPPPYGGLLARRSGEIEGRPAPAVVQQVPRPSMLAKGSTDEQPTPTPVTTPPKPAIPATVPTAAIPPTAPASPPPPPSAVNTEPPQFSAIRGIFRASVGDLDAAADALKKLGFAAKDIVAVRQEFSRGGPQPPTPSPTPQPISATQATATPPRPTPAPQSPPTAPATAPAPTSPQATPTPPVATSPPPQASPASQRPRPVQAQPYDPTDALDVAKKRIADEEFRGLVDVEYAKLKPATPPPPKPPFDPLEVAKKRIEAEDNRAAAEAEYAKLKPPKPEPAFDPMEVALKRREAERKAAQVNAAYKKQFGSDDDQSTLGHILEIAGKFRGAIGGLAGTVVGATLDIVEAFRKSGEEANKKRKDAKLLAEAEYGTAKTAPSTAKPLPRPTSPPLPVLPKTTATPSATAPLPVTSATAAAQPVQPPFRLPPLPEQIGPPRPVVPIPAPNLPWGGPPPLPVPPFRLPPLPEQIGPPRPITPVPAPNLPWGGPPPLPAPSLNLPPVPDELFVGPPRPVVPLPTSQSDPTRKPLPSHVPPRPGPPPPRPASMQPPTAQAPTPTTPPPLPQANPADPDNGTGQKKPRWVNTWGSNGPVAPGGSVPPPLPKTSNTTTSTSVAKAAEQIGTTAATNALGPAAEVAATALGTTVPVIGAFVIGITAGIKVVSALMDEFDKMAKKYGDYNPEIAQAQAIVEIKGELKNFSRAQESSKELAQYVRAQGELQQKWEDIKVKLMTKLLTIVVPIMDSLEKIMAAGDGIENSILTLSSPMTAIASTAAQLLWMKRDETKKDVQDPTEAILTRGVDAPMSPEI